MGRGGVFLRGFCWRRGERRLEMGRSVGGGIAQDSEERGGGGGGTVQAFVVGGASEGSVSSE